MVAQGMMQKATNNTLFWHSQISEWIASTLGEHSYAHTVQTKA